MGYYDELPELNINDKLEDMKYVNNSVIVDVRTPGEFREGHVPGAINIRAELCGRSGQSYVEGMLPDKTAHIYMYCYSGARSGIASAYLRQMGYAQAENIGGFKDYIGPIEDNK